jgi:hypothetical protein
MSAERSAGLAVIGADEISRDKMHFFRHICLMQQRAISLFNVDVSIDSGSFAGVMRSVSFLGTRRSLRSLSNIGRDWHPQFVSAFRHPQFRSGTERSRHQGGF